MRTLCVIPARYASTRLPGKPLADIHGKPLIRHVYERAARAARSDGLLVATDDTRIRDAVLAFGGQVRLTRPDHPSGTHRVAEVAAAVPADIYVNVQGDEPCLDPADIDRLADALAAHPDWDVASLCCPGTPEDLRTPHVVKVVCAHDGRALYFSRAPIPYPREPGPAPLRHIGLYAYRREVLLHLDALPPSPLARTESLEQLQFLQAGLAIGMVRTGTSPGPSVDTPEDLEAVRTLLAPGTENGPAPTGSGACA